METWGFLPSATYFVHRFEAKEYRQKHKGINVVEVPDALQGNVARVRNFILDRNRDVEWALMVDDDMTKVGRFFDKRQTFVDSETELMSLVARFSAFAFEWGVKMWGFNVNPDKQCYREYTPFSTLSYVSASFCCFHKSNVIRYDERFSLKEDYDMTIQQVNDHRKVLRFNAWFYVKKGAEQPGGCAVYRNVGREMEQIELLQKKWGKEIVSTDSLERSRSHSTKKVRKFDINPIVRIPIKGV